MRKFSEFEKKIIRQLVNISLIGSNVLSFIANCVLENRGIKILEKERTIKFIYKLTDTETPTEIFETIALFKYLESNHLIFKHSNKITQYVGDFVTKNMTQQEIIGKANEYGEFPIPTDVFDKIQDYKTSYMIVGTELKSLVLNNFKTIDDIKHEKEMKIAYISLFVAFVALLFSFLSPFLFDTKIEQNQLDNFGKQLKNNDKEIIREMENLNIQSNFKELKKVIETKKVQNKK